MTNFGRLCETKLLGKKKWSRHSSSSLLPNPCSFTWSVCSPSRATKKTNNWQTLDPYLPSAPPVKITAPPLCVKNKGVFDAAFCSCSQWSSSFHLFFFCLSWCVLFLFCLTMGDLCAVYLWRIYINRFYSLIAAQRAVSLFSLNEPQLGGPEARPTASPVQFNTPQTPRTTPTFSGWVSSPSGINSIEMVRVCRAATWW